MSDDDAPRDPVTGRVPPSADDLRDPGTVPLWPVGQDAGPPLEDVDKTGTTEIERRLLGVLEREYARLRQHARGSARWGEALSAAQAVYRALRSLYMPPWVGEYPWENEGTSRRGWEINLEWATRVY